MYFSKTVFMFSNPSPETSINDWLFGGLLKLLRISGQENSKFKCTFQSLKLRFQDGRHVVFGDCTTCTYVDIWGGLLGVNLSIVLTR